MRDVIYLSAAKTCSQASRIHELCVNVKTSRSVFVITILHLSSVIAGVRDDVVRKVRTGICFAVNVLSVWSVLVCFRNDEVSSLSNQISGPQWKLQGVTL